MHGLISRVAASAILVIPSLALAQADHQHEADIKRLGAVEFPTSCAEAVQKDFTRAVAMLHSFWFDQANRAFEQVAKADPNCAMAQWGIAMTLLGNPFVRAPIPEARLTPALAAAERAVQLAAKQSPREQAWAEAAAVLYRNAATNDHLARMKLHEAAMAKVREQNPTDIEATIFYSRAVIANAPPEDLTFGRQKVAAELLEPIFRKQSRHPGLAHYLIHAYDAPPIASNGLDAARRYADIAPAAPHALHMPSHIFTRVGLWDESIETNKRSARAEPDSNAAVHPMDYMVYAYLQLGRDGDAEAVVSRATQNKDEFYRGQLGYNFTAMPARFALERGDWAAAARLKLPVNANPEVEAITRFARAIGASRSRQVAIARAETDTLGLLVAKLRSQNNNYWATIVEAQRLAAASWTAHAQRRTDEAIDLARRAAELEETIEKHPVTPGPLLPARELQGDLLLELGKSAEAQAAYEKTLQREPRRARALYGVARSAELAGNDDVARKRYREVLELMKKADKDRLEPRRAGQFLSGR